MASTSSAVAECPFTALPHTHIDGSVAARPLFANTCGALTLPSDVSELHLPDAAFDRHTGCSDDLGPVFVDDSDSLSGGLETRFSKAFTTPGRLKPDLLTVRP